jgi:ubiquinone/menaquinone biosynthesis C-methylase UbiE
MTERKIHDAIDLHNVQSSLFQNRYVLFQEDPYQTTFTYGRKKTDEIIDTVLAAYPAPKDVLDVGCGTGHAIHVLSGMGYKCTGVDAAEDMLSIARRENPNIRFESADARALPFEDNSFDMVISIEVLRYIREREKSVTEIFRVLKPGGRMVGLVDPQDHRQFSSFDEYHPLKYLEHSREEWLEIAGEINFHNQLTTPEHRAMIDASGFEVERWDDLMTTAVTEKQWEGFHPMFKKMDRESIGVLRFGLSAVKIEKP